MATIVLGTLGTVFGGSLGGALGSLIGRQIDGKIFGSPTRDGPRLKELTVSNSSYGQPIARHFGQVRAAGTFIWSTDLVEHRKVQGGGKGKPKVATYSYTVSFAVALSSRPIDGIGRIWADGNLLRGAAGDLKAGGTLRVYKGHADQERDPQLFAHLGDQCPAHRGCAYVVFEDLDLSDFGNRIPALSFEIFAGSGASLIEALVNDTVAGASADAPFPELQGFSYEGGTLGQVVALIDRLNPVVPIGRGGAVALVSAGGGPGEPKMLPLPARWSDGDFGREDGIGRARRSQADRALSALRYYDLARDYQPGLQRAEGRVAERALELEFPGTLAAEDARTLARNAAARGATQRETLAWRLAELDPALAPGAIVRAPGEPGLWLVAAWEWRQGGVELQLLRHMAAPSATLASDAGSSWTPPDRLPQPSLLRAFEVPWDGTGTADTRTVFAAVSAPTGRWDGAALYLDNQGALVPLGQSATVRAVTGTLEQPLPPSNALLFEPLAKATIALADHDAQLAAASLALLTGGANRVLIGSEIVQFASAAPLGNGRWELSGLLRGRGGTEHEALRGQPTGRAVTLLDDRLVSIDPQSLASSIAPRLAALGAADAAPVVADTENPGASRRPPSPVHPRLMVRADGGLDLGWTRRARGGWTWLNEVEQPLVEQSETYEIGVGSVSTPATLWTTNEPRLTLTAATRTALAQSSPGAAIWVRQCGSYAKSDALLLGSLS